MAKSPAIGRDGARQQYAAISAWLPTDNTANGPVVALVTKASVVSVWQLWVIPIDSDQLHATHLTHSRRAFAQTIPFVPRAANTRDSESLAFCTCKHVGSGAGHQIVLNKEML
jgi:hypothetical protein